MNTSQATLFDVRDAARSRGRRYLGLITALKNNKGVMDVDTVKGCTLGIAAYGPRGCYNACYAARTASRYGIDFSRSVSRRLGSMSWRRVWREVANHPASWYRIGTAGDPSHDWEHTVAACERLASTGKIPVIITKHWRIATDEHLKRLRAVGAVFNTSVSGLDTDAEIRHRLFQLMRVHCAGIRSVARVVTCKFGDTDEARIANARQAFLLSIRPHIDNPLRLSRSDPRVQSGFILGRTVSEAIGGGKFVSLHDDGVYLGRCDECPDQCGVSA